MCGSRCKATAEVPPGVEVVRRRTEDATFLFMLNHNHEAKEIRLPEPGRDLLTGAEHRSSLVLEPLEVVVLKEGG